MTKENIDNDPYKSAGVDITAGNNLIELIKGDVALTQGKDVLGGIGGFAGMYRLNNDFQNPVLVACTDGVGTKVALAQQYNNLENIGQDLVAMCVNDLVTCGAQPLFFLDYFATSKLDVKEASLIIGSIARACRASGCALLGGETAEMPGHYIDNNFDLAGFSVGCVDEDKIIKGDDIEDGDILTPQTILRVKCVPYYWQFEYDPYNPRSAPQYGRTYYPPAILAQYQQAGIDISSLN